MSSTSGSISLCWILTSIFISEELESATILVTKLKQSSTVEMWDVKNKKKNTKLRQVSTKTSMHSLMINILISTQLKFSYHKTWRGSHSTRLHMPALPMVHVCPVSSSKRITFWEATSSIMEIKKNLRSKVMPWKWHSLTNRNVLRPSQAQNRIIQLNQCFQVAKSDIVVKLSGKWLH